VEQTALDAVEASVPSSVTQQLQQGGTDAATGDEFA
jgi:hypothetical protein